MAKKAVKKKSTKRSQKPKEPDGPVPGPHIAESIMASLFGSRHDPGQSAQEYAYEAMDAMADGDWDRAEAAAIRAVELNPDCVDALHILAQLGCESDSEMITELQFVVQRGEQELGKKFFRENEGWFWGLLETRPYMRARCELAYLLRGEGRVDEAIGHWEEMLRLNPNDNQGVRYPLLGAYLQQGDLEGAGRLFAEYPEEHSAMFAWGRVLWEVLSENLKQASRSLDEARSRNEHVEPLLTGRKRRPKNPPGYYSPGEPSEAYVCLEEIGPAWKKHRGAIRWLKEQTDKA